MSFYVSSCLPLSSISQIQYDIVMQLLVLFIYYIFIQYICLHLGILFICIEFIVPLKFYRCCEVIVVYFLVYYFFKCILFYALKWFRDLNNVLKTRVGN